MVKPKRKDVTERSDFGAACMMIAAVVTAGNLAHSRSWITSSIPKGLLTLVITYVGALFLVFLFGMIGSAAYNWGLFDEDDKKGIGFWICYTAACLGVSFLIAAILNG